MTKDEITQQLKNEALNKIKKIYDNFAYNSYSHHLEEDGSYKEQDWDRIQCILMDLETSIKINKREKDNKHSTTT